jgi:hypothetical protein
MKFIHQIEREQRSRKSDFSVSSTNYAKPDYIECVIAKQELKFWEDKLKTETEELWIKDALKRIDYFKKILETCRKYYTL